jgi:hypothetical protein
MLPSISCAWMLQVTGAVSFIEPFAQRCAYQEKRIYGYDSIDHCYPIIDRRIAHLALQLRMGLLSKRRARSGIFDRLDPPSLEANLMRWEQLPLPHPLAKCINGSLQKSVFFEIF